MNTVHHLIATKIQQWKISINDENQLLVKNLLDHIERHGKLRPPQQQAIETYLWIKFVGQNKKLSDMVRTGLLYDDERAREYDNYHTFSDNYITQFLNQFFLDNNLKKLHTKMVNDPHSEKTDWSELLEELLHNFSYPNYLYSLPMGTGKTFLMACFIYLDLYFSTLFKDNKCFAHNFIVFAPHASKTAILPALRSIKDFDPQWILPEREAEKIKQLITIEILDSLSSKRKDKLQGNNPNLEKVNRIKQTKEFGLVFITNAEKVVLEKTSDRDRDIANPKHIFYDKKKAAQIKKTNDLRESLSQIPNITVILDEVHHSYGNNGNGEKKLRQAVDTLNQHNHLNSVIGLSGTPYVKNTIPIGGETIRLNQIQDIVYNYPLNQGVGKFLKEPIIKTSEVTKQAFITQALTDFFDGFDKQYNDGTTSKIAFYCPSIAKLNDEILPIIQKWYSQNRRGKEEEIFRYYSKVGKENKQYALPKDSLAIFNNLDKPYSKKRVILLVAVGTEGWNCRSLTAVVLPRQKTTKNFVLQTTCRCLREVDDASQENALVWLSRDNYETLDKELKDNYQLSISDLKASDETDIEIQIRKPKLGKITYNQIETKYKLVKTIESKISEKLKSFDLDAIKKAHWYDQSIIQGKIGKHGLTDDFGIKDVTSENIVHFSYSDFLYQLADCSYGRLCENELDSEYYSELAGISQQIQSELEWITLNPKLDIRNVVNMVAQIFMGRVEYDREIIEKETVIELLEWEGSGNTISVVSSSGAVYKIMPKIPKNELSGRRGFINNPTEIEEYFFGVDENCDPQDISYNYAPYKMDSEFEQNALTAMVQMAELKNLEVYFNGYKDAKLESFWIQTPRGRYTPDFLIVRREGGKKYDKTQTKNNVVAIEKILIIETKGEVYYTEEFKAKEKFVKNEFLMHNKNFTYHCFRDEGGNDFSRHAAELKNVLKAF